jgi:hypothetical protein
MIRNFWEKKSLSQILLLICWWLWLLIQKLWRLWLDIIIAAASNSDFSRTTERVTRRIIHDMTSSSPSALLSDRLSRDTFIFLLNCHLLLLLILWWIFCAREVHVCSWTYSPCVILRLFHYTWGRKSFSNTFTFDFLFFSLVRCQSSSSKHCCFTGCQSSSMTQTYKRMSLLPWFVVWKTSLVVQQQSHHTQKSSSRLSP